MLRNCQIEGAVGSGDYEAIGISHVTIDGVMPNRNRILDRSWMAFAEVPGGNEGSTGSKTEAPEQGACLG